MLLYSLQLCYLPCVSPYLSLALQSRLIHSSAVAAQAIVVAGIIAARRRPGLRCANPRLALNLITAGLVVNIVECRIENLTALGTLSVASIAVYILLAASIKP